MKKALAVLLAAALLLALVPVLAESVTAVEGLPVFAWGGQGNVQLVRIAECPDEIKNQLQHRPSGKLIVIEFVILDGAEMDSVLALNFAQENVWLDQYIACEVFASGVKMVDTPDGGFDTVLVGTIDVIFDVPADYDLNRAVVLVCGTQVPVPLPAQ